MPEIQTAELPSKSQDVPEPSALLGLGFIGGLFKFFQPHKS
ncbi:PEP-CTERM sorting domain-containing protein [Limnoraphis robusta Tam1]|nr:PEP-CTERM sorting domain-containing protein [Limnoraphis robusta]MEA5539289.1 PEP-CTERM sorting domain-containing protein [Limnoraphis robusta Tam1]